MDQFENVLCLCPSSRLTLASLVLSTWTQVRRFVLTEDVATVSDLEGFSAVVIMDGFVTRALVEDIIRKLPVFVLAWNGPFEIGLHRKLLGDLDVTYLGTEQTVAKSEEPHGAVRYLPFINGRCSYMRWRALYEQKTQFSAVGGARYRARWFRTRLLPTRPLNVLISTLGSVRHPTVMRNTLESAVTADKLVWAGNCYLDYAGLGFTPEEQQALQSRIAAANAARTVDARLEACLDLVHDWQQTLVAPRSEPFPHAFYVTNTLLRWAVLGTLKAAMPSGVWFFGKDNVGLELDLELYVHNLVPSRRIVFLELGGKTSEAGLYPRSLHLLARQFYVIPIATARDEVIATLGRLRSGAATQRQEFFRELEQRRRGLYASTSEDDELQTVQQRVWSDFAAAI